MHGAVSACEQPRRAERLQRHAAKLAVPAFCEHENGSGHRLQLLSLVEWRNDV
ncbi:hypothetical protein D3C86_2117440 [compost metagenome]